MIRLFATTDNVRKELDVDGSVEINFQGKPIDGVGKNAGSYSTQMKMPFSKNNNQFFEYYYEVNIEQDTFNHYNVVEVELYDDQNLLFTGQLQLLSVNVFRKDYECMVISSVVSLYSIIRGMTWRELFRDNGVVNIELDHALTDINVILSWDTGNDITSGQVGSGTIVYALTDNAQIEYNPKRWYYNGEGVTNIWEQGITQEGFIQANTLRPAILVKYLIAKVFQKAGFVYESSFMASSEMDKLYMLTATHLNGPSMRTAYGSKVALSTSLTLDYTSTDYVQLNFNNELNDPDNLFQQGNFVAPYNGTFQIRIITTGAGNGGDTFVLGAQVNDAGPVYTQSSLIPSSSTVGAIDYFTLALEEGDSVTFFIKIYSTANFVLNTNTTAELYVYQSSSSFVDMVGCLPDCTVDEWLRAIAQQFNLVFVPKTNSPTTVIIETAEDYYALGTTVKDWTQKVDLDKDVIIRPTTREQSRRVVFEDAEGKDFHNAYWQFAFGQVKGRHIMENDNVHAQGEEKIGDFFAPLRMSNIGTFNNHAATLLPDLFVINLWNLRNGEPQATTGKPMLMYYHGAKPVGGTMYIGQYSVSNYGLFTHMSNTTGEPLSLRWGHSWPDYVGHQYFPYTTKNLFRTYYAANLMRIYDVHARTLYCDMYLKSADINQLNMYDRVWVYNAYYRIIGISGYQVGARGSAKVELLKDIDVTKFNCTIIPNLFNDDGTISFVDAKTGLATTANEVCCTYYGYAWDAQTNSCLWSGGADTNGPPPVAPWGDTNVIDNFDPPLPPQEEQTDSITGISGNIYDEVLFGETISNETINLHTQLNASQLYVGKGPSYAGTIHILGKRLSDGLLVNEIFSIHFNTETNQLTSTSVQKNGSFGSFLPRASTSSSGIQMAVTGVNGEPCSWIARLNLMSINTDVHQLPTTSDIHGADALFNGAANIYVEYNGGNDHMIFNG